jgi:hypothetical protein
MFRRRLTLDQIVTTEAQKARLTERRNALRIKIRAWEIIQPIYMPGLLQYLAVVPQTSTPLDEHPESHIIYLPSTIAPEQCAQVCIGGVGVRFPIDCNRFRNLIESDPVRPKEVAKQDFPTLTTIFIVARDKQAI